MTRMIHHTTAGMSMIAALALAGCGNPAKDVTPAEVGEPQTDVTEPTAEAPSAEAIAYEISSDSTIRFVGSKVTGSHDGGFKSFNGSIAVADGSLLAAGSAVEIDMASTWTDTDRLTGHLKSGDFFGVEENPTSTFVFTSVKPSGEEFGITISGDLTLHGVTRNISFPAQVKISDEKLMLKSEFYIKRFDFEITYPGKTDDLIREEVVIRLAILAAPA